MSANMPSLNAQQYANNIQLLLQQKDSRLKNFVMNGSHIGEQASPVDQIEKIEMQAPAGRYADIGRVDAAVDRRWVLPNDYDLPQLLDSFDQARLLIDPKSSYVANAVAAANRQMDRELINAFFGTAKTGKTGSTSTSFLSANQVAVTMGASGATGGIEFSGVLEFLAGANTTAATSTGALPEKDIKNAITRIFNNTGAKPTHIFCNPEVAYRIASFNQTNIRVPAGSAPGGVTSESLGYYSTMGNMMEVVPVRPDLLASGNVVILTAPFLQVLHATDNLIDIEEIPANEADVLSIRMKSYLTLEMRNLQAHARLTGVTSVVE